MRIVIGRDWLGYYQGVFASVDLFVLLDLVDASCTHVKEYDMVPAYTYSTRPSPACYEDASPWLCSPSKPLGVHINSP